MGSPEGTWSPVTSSAEPGSQAPQDGTRKRKHSTNETRTGRPTKYRASQACQYCRTRKVRCDVLINRGGCTNCTLDSRECIVLASRRGRPERVHDDRGARDLPKSPVPRCSGQVSDSNPNTTGTDNMTNHGAMSTPMDSADAGDVPVCVTFEEDEKHDTSTTDYTPSAAHDVPRRAAHEAISNPLQHYPSPPGIPALPAFITPLPARILTEDLDFLARKGAFTVPEPEIRAEILRGYIFSVHPFMPMLDLKPFVDAVSNEGEDSRVSLLLFQAVMFAGLSSLELPFVHQLGFESAKKARGVFFTRVKLLYEFDVEPDCAAVFQALLLMSSWYSNWNEWRDTWHWAGLAHLVAQNMGLHREPTQSCGSDKTRRFRRRLWWSLYIRDRTLALGTRRPMRIRDEDFDVAMLTLDDFDIEPLDEFNRGSPLNQNAEEQKCTALMCIELAKLCVCIGHVLSTQYTTMSNQPTVPHTVMVVARRDGQRINELSKCDDEINEWLQALGPNLRKPGSSAFQDGSQSCSEVHWAILNMAHHTLVNVLHRTQALQPLSDAPEALAVQRTSRLKVKDAARNVTKIAQTMLHRNQVRFLGLGGITALLAACLSHMVDIRSGDEDVRDASIFRFYQSMQVLQSMRSMYATADSAVSFLVSIIRKAGLPVPAQVAMPALDLMSASAESLVPLTTSGRQNPDPNDSTASQDGFWGMGNVSPTAVRADWQSNHSQTTLQPRSHSPLALLDSNRQVLPTSGEMHIISIKDTGNPSTDAFAASSYISTSSQAALNTTKDAPTREHNSFHFMDTPRILSNSGANEPFLDWNSGLDSTMDFEPIAFNYDFCSDTFGFLERG
ncbi:hypothetical protein A1O3_04610 [Capronia epimyces CBS 606.96]|uniref:Zn(2)-C6 fungal-type domain-containing protein n=1 Tax=Capronia epimyces CBS 606.96 TaxID=1182542 RepID=W9XUQ2_9EURO|nr:uncharacterized protein A1O3_04610 [Capronia epimyces CBS 606.96]EXJ83943.1 hypothetical protein A1O3_04610 [Capronia epimyces CBS 606.96]